jgi:hypothetical protein
MRRLLAESRFRKISSDFLNPPAKRRQRKKPKIAVTGAPTDSGISLQHGNRRRLFASRFDAFIDGFEP